MPWDLIAGVLVDIEIISESLASIAESLKAKVDAPKKK